MLDGVGGECEDEFFILRGVLLKDGLETFRGRINDAILLIIVIFLNNAQVRKQPRNNLLPIGSRDIIGHIGVLLRPLPIFRSHSLPQLHDLDAIILLFGVGYDGLEEGDQAVYVVAEMLVGAFGEFAKDL